MKISSILRDLLAFRAGRSDMGDAAWDDDPYAHPEICAMTERERADLPPVHMDVASHGVRASLAACS
jgi:hypothetical protein